MGFVTNIWVERIYSIVFGLDYIHCNRSMLYSYSPAEIAEKLIGEAKPAEALAASDK